jgi:hypothetical protein
MSSTEYILQYYHHSIFIHHYFETSNNQQSRYLKPHEPHLWFLLIISLGSFVIPVLIYMVIHSSQLFYVELLWLLSLRVA